jgi:serine/arginine repetitive matrix protein 2
MITGLPTPPPSATRPDIHRLDSADSVLLPDNKSHHGVMLSALSRPNTPALQSPPSRAGTPTPNTLQLPPSRAGTPSPALIVPMPDEDACKEKDGKGSLAIRAMKSFARIGSWAQLKNSSGPSDKEGRRKKGSSDSASSWEAGDYTMARSILSPAVDGTFRSRLSAKSSGGDSSASSNHLSAESAYNGVGLGWPGGSKRLSTLSTASSLAPVSTYSRDGSKGSTCSSSGDWHTGRLSVQSEASNPPPAAPIRARALSTDAAVQRPPKSSTWSIRWDENLNSNLETIKEKRRGAKERRGGTTVAAPLTPTPDALPSTPQVSTQSGKSPEGLQRGRLSDLFPDVVQSTRVSVIERVVTGSEDEDDSIKRVVVESATSESECSTPPRVRARPMSENLLGARPRAVVVPAKEGGDGKPLNDKLLCNRSLVSIAAISILNAATSDLASLINRLDLQATPENGISPSAARSLFASRDSTAAFGTPHKVPLLPASPSKKSPKESPSITSLRPYNKAAAAKSRTDVNSTIRASVVSTDTDNTTGSHGPVFPCLVRRTPSGSLLGPMLGRLSILQHAEFSVPVQPRKWPSYLLQHPPPSYPKARLTRNRNSELSEIFNGSSVVSRETPSPLSLTVMAVLLTLTALLSQTIEAQSAPSRYHCRRE